MTDSVENLVLEQLRAIRATQTEHGNGLIQIELQLSAMGQQLGGLTTAVYSGKSSSGDSLLIAPAGPSSATLGQ
ncbi:MAG: hypothetical protein K9L32_13060 [Chromatiaceae bacterium]|nr:hypothetical protein [Chromatiaceae bacterium]MCF8005104.1 hypothetical protein [Chromatiaceae bacterium]